jgi:hypothetical protein
VLLLAPGLELAPPPLGVLAPVVELLEGAADDAAAVGLDALVRRELGQVVLERLLDELVALRRHRVDDDVAQVLPAVAAVDAVLLVALLRAHRLPRLLADLLADGLHDGLDEQPLRAARAVAGVGHQHGVLAEPMEADVLGRRAACSRPAADAVLLLVRLHPLGEDGPRVGKDARLDVLEDRLGRATLRHDREAPQAEVLTRAVKVLDLEVAREDGVTELRRLVPPEAQHALALGELVSSHRLARQRDLAAHDLVLARAARRRVEVGREDGEHILNVG